MVQSVKLETLARDPRQRKRMYSMVRPLYDRIYGKAKGLIAYKHAWVVSEEVSRYLTHAKDQNWAGRCVLLSSVHSFGMRALDVVVRIFPEGDRTSLIRSFNRFNILRNQDETAPEHKDGDIYRALAAPYISEEGLILLHPEIIVRVVDMSVPQYYKGAKAQELHDIMPSRAPLEVVNRNLADSMLRYWRPAAIQLLFFSCYDRMSNLAAHTMHEALFLDITRQWEALENETVRVEQAFGAHLGKLVSVAAAKKIPLVKQTERETGNQVQYTIRNKTPGSATLTLIIRKDVDPAAKSLDPDFVLEALHDKVACALVSDRTCDAENLFQLVKRRDESIIVQAENIFYGRGGHYSGSLGGYRETGHIDYDAGAFGAERIRRVELHVKSYRGYLDHYYSPQASRGARESQFVSDAWGDQNYAIVRALGNVNHEAPGAWKAP